MSEFLLSVINSVGIFRALLYPLLDFSWYLPILHHADYILDASSLQTFHISMNKSNRKKTAFVLKNNNARDKFTVHQIRSKAIQIRTLKNEENHESQSNKMEFWHEEF